MSDDARVVWLDAGQGREDAVGALAEWARARGVRLLALEVSAPQVPVDPALADRVEGEIAYAREAIGAMDADNAERALARAESLLRAHPELPQAAWLRAEIERTWSTRWLRVEPRDATRAQTAWATAQALDGGRVPGIGERRFLPHARVNATIVVAAWRGSPPRLWFDGAPLDPPASTGDDAGTGDDARDLVYQLEAAPAEHHVLATSNGRVAFASWIAIAGAEPPPTRIAVMNTDPCASEGLEGVRRAGGRIDAAGVTCPRWLAAVPGEKRDSVLVARCERDACGPLLEWHIEHYDAQRTSQAREKQQWPAWATWTILGIGAATATAVALIASGALDAPPVERRFVVGGARQE